MKIEVLENEKMSFQKNLKFKKDFSETEIQQKRVKITHIGVALALMLRGQLIQQQLGALVTATEEGRARRAGLPRMLMRTKRGDGRNARAFDPFDDVVFE